MRNSFQTIIRLRFGLKWFVVQKELHSLCFRCSYKYSTIRVTLRNLNYENISENCRLKYQIFKIQGKCFIQQVYVRSCNCLFVDVSMNLGLNIYTNRFSHISILSSWRHYDWDAQGDIRKEYCALNIKKIKKGIFLCIFLLQ